MREQAQLFDPTAFQAEPWQAPSNLKRIEFIPLVKQNAVELARRYESEVLELTSRFEDSELIDYFSRGFVVLLDERGEFIEPWLLTQYDYELKNG